MTMSAITAGTTATDVLATRQDPKSMENSQIFKNSQISVQGHATKNSQKH